MGERTSALKVQTQNLGGEMEQEDNIFSFMARRPQYTEQHVRDIAREMDHDGVPFCRRCDDWHYASEDCSE